MTNQEAVARIKDHKAIHKMNEPRAIYISQALDKAIEALEKQKSIIDELESIKTVLENLSENEWNQKVGADKGLDLAIEVIKDRLSELKGENK